VPTVQNGELTAMITRIRSKYARIDPLAYYNTSSSSSSLLMGFLTLQYRMGLVEEDLEPSFRVKIYGGYWMGDGRCIG
jgi:hypothetical protein